MNSPLQIRHGHQKLFSALMTTMLVGILVHCQLGTAIGQAGCAWTALGSGMDSDVLALHHFDIGIPSFEAIYAGGWFTTAGGVSANHVAMWDGSDWHALVDVGNGVNGTVHALASFMGELYVGGFFTTAGNKPVRSIAKWDPLTGTWDWVGAMNNGPDGAIYAMCVYGGDLYVAGEFASLYQAGIPFFSPNIAKWNGTTWLAVGGITGVSSSVRALTVYNDGLSGDVLVAGGIFTSPALNVAQWNGSAWSAIGIGNEVPENVYALASFCSGGPELWVGGGLGLRTWNGAAWAGPINPVGSSIRALTVFQDRYLIAGGDTGYIGNEHIMQYDGSAWSSMSGGLDGGVFALAASGHAVYAGGFFHNTNDYGPAMKVARWGCGTDPSEIPTLSNWGILALLLVLGGTAVWVLWRRGRQTEHAHE